MNISIYRKRMVYKLGEPIWLECTVAKIWNAVACFILGHERCGDVGCGDGDHCPCCVWCGKEIQ